MKKNNTVTWVGLDVHKDTIAVSWLHGDSQAEETREIPNDERAIRRLFKRLADCDKLRVCYEAGPCGYTVRRQLQQMGIACDVIAPSMIPRRPGSQHPRLRRQRAPGIDHQERQRPRSPRACRGLLAIPAQADDGR